MKRHMGVLSALMVSACLVFALPAPPASDTSLTDFKMFAGYYPGVPGSNILTPSPVVLRINMTSMSTSALLAFSYQFKIIGNVDGHDESIIWNVGFRGGQIICQTNIGADGNRTFVASHVPISVNESCTDADGNQSKSYRGIIDSLQVSMKNGGSVPNDNNLKQRIADDACGGHSKLAKMIMNNQIVLQQVGDGMRETAALKPVVLPSQE